jgi:hypothetical protein
MMSPAVFQKGRMLAPATIDPEGSLVAELGYADFGVDDYMRQFGDRDRAQLAAARQIEANRALREQQDREHADAVEQYRQLNAAKTIQRVFRGYAGRKKAAQMRVDTATMAAAAAANPQTREELRKAQLKRFG